ncbi:MAG: type II secretion system protein [Verrucomicrobia bacterium]|nr:type II secretion system protein [Verrucomicrobiota bacterium]
MNTERTTIPDLAPSRQPVRARHAFTLIELMVVISIIAVLAALTLGLLKYATAQKKVSRIEGEMHKWITLIEYYHDKMGFYPPCNTNNPALSPLYYELSGTVFSPTTNRYDVLARPDIVEKTVVALAFSAGGFVNASTDPAEVKRFGTIPESDLVIVTNDAWGTAVKLPRVPVLGPGPFWPGPAVDPRPQPTTTNTWYYNSVNPLHNPNSYDLWAVYYLDGELRTNGNWKR